MQPVNGFEQERTIGGDESLHRIFVSLQGVFLIHNRNLFPSRNEEIRSPVVPYIYHDKPLQ